MAGAFPEPLPTVNPKQRGGGSSAELRPCPTGNFGFTGGGGRARGGESGGGGGGRREEPGQPRIAPSPAFVRAPSGARGREGTQGWGTARCQPSQSIPGRARRVWTGLGAAPSCEGCAAPAPPRGVDPKKKGVRPKKGGWRQKKGEDGAQKGGDAPQKNGMDPKKGGFRSRRSSIPCVNPGWR